MKKRVTVPGTLADTAHTTREASHVSMIMLTTVVLAGILLFATSVAFTGHGWLESLNTALLILCPIILIGTLVTQRKGNYSSAKHSNATYCDDEIAHLISWAPLRPYATGESRNCKISHCSNNSRMLFEPILSFQYTALILAATVIGCLITASLTASLPMLLKRGVTATSDPTYTTFIALFSIAVMSCVGWLLKKPVRAVVFAKEQGVFWIEKYRVFGWKVGESAQMPIAQIHALQIINFSKSSASLLQADQNEMHGDELAKRGCSSDQVREYEINVVFRNGERVNIISHRNCRAIMHDATALASFLEIPVWDRQPAPAPE